MPATPGSAYTLGSSVRTCRHRRMGAPPLTGGRDAQSDTDGNGPVGPRRYLVPLDGSPLAEQALVPALCLARATGGEITLVHVTEPAPRRPQPPAGSGTEYLSRVIERLPDDLALRPLVHTGDPVSEILGAALDGPPAIIVMATHGRSGADRLLFGSVADRVVRRATVPVVVVRAGMCLQEHGLRQLLVPLDGSELAEAALPPALGLLGGEASLRLVRVVDGSAGRGSLGFGLGALMHGSELAAELTEAAVLEARDHLNALSERLRLRGVRVGWEIRHGRASDEIIRTAETTGADLIAMATHGEGGWRRWAFGSVTDQVLHRSSVPVMVIPPGAGAPPGPLPT